MIGFRTCGRGSNSPIESEVDTNPSALPQEERDNDAALITATEDDAKATGRSRPSFPYAIKILVSNNVAGSLIGKAGSSINDLQTETKARIKLSQSQEFFPGTQDRVVLLTGSREAVAHANAIVWDRIAHDSESSPRRSTGALPADHVCGRIAIPSPASGLIIGRSGGTIRHICEVSTARIQLANKDESNFTQERIAIVTGTLQSCTKCVEMIVDKLVEDAKVGRYANLTTSYSRPVAAYGYSNTSPRHSHTEHSHLTCPPPAKAVQAPAMPPISASALTSVPGAETLSSVQTINMAVNDMYVGILLGKNGAAMAEIQSLSGARVTISPRGEYIPGTSNRSVTITGTSSAASMAQFLILQKIQNSVTQSHGGILPVNTPVMHGDSKQTPTPTTSMHAGEGGISRGRVV